MQYIISAYRNSCNGTFPAKRLHNFSTKDWSFNIPDWTQADLLHGPIFHSWLAVLVSIWFVVGTAQDFPDRCITTLWDMFLLWHKSLSFAEHSYILWFLFNKITWPPDHIIKLLTRLCCTFHWFPALWLHLWTQDIRKMPNYLEHSQRTYC